MHVLYFLYHCLFLVFYQMIHHEIQTDAILTNNLKKFRTNKYHLDKKSNELPYLDSLFI
jgi:hypothetical protein